MIQSVTAGRPSDATLEGDEVVLAMFSAADLALDPEVYAARHAHEWGCFSYHHYRYKDPTLGRWVRRVGEIFASEEELEGCRQRHLSSLEREAISRLSAEDF